MAGLLDRLIHESPSDRIPAIPGARDEINAMAESLNILADHRANFIKWWNAAMSEATALRDLHEASGQDARDAAVEELRQAALVKVQQLNGLRGQLLKQADAIEASALRLRANKQTTVIVEANQLARSALDIRSLLEVTA
jgi:methyl-accepting chemotaxis protein